MNSSRVRLEAENRAFAASLPPGAIVLDAGAGRAPYAPLFGHCSYESADFCRVDKPYAEQTYTCDLAAIPVEDGRYDAVIFNQVMEHLPEPAAVLAELHRILKPGGKLLYTGPFFYEEHEQPYDFFRYTRYGTRHLMERAGFAVERLDWLEGYFGTLGYQFETASRCLPRRAAAYGGGIGGALYALAALALKPALRLMSLALHRLDLRAKYTERGYPKNYVAIASKAAVAAQPSAARA
ncbi:MAG TPA: class I SAM-dependent methyltransferase [Alphaproteobacteria bacterium]|nr:class I SAM-dependent methyltransferase [Alphaproteobacteria bacterium]